MPGITQRNLQRDTLRKMVRSSEHAELIALRLAYSEDSKLLTGYVNRLVKVPRIYPRHAPIQASGRWSTIDPPITNWPRACVAPTCPQEEHEWTDTCWSVKDILLPDEDEVLITWDHDNIEGKIHDLIVNDSEAIKAHKQGYDLHTITCCNIFGYVYPPDLRDPHVYCTCDHMGSHVGAMPLVHPDSSVHMQDGDISDRCEHCRWRAEYKWQGKDTKQRVLAKNFNHGSKYTKTWRFVYRIEGIEKYGVQRSHLGELARRYIASKGEAWQHKLRIMESIRRAREARTLFGFRRVFFDSSEETGREGFSHMISGTVSDYNNQTLIHLHDWCGDSIRLMHNAHDGDKIAVKRQWVQSNYGTDIDQFKDDLRAVIERPIEYQGRSLIMTAGVKVYV